MVTVTADQFPGLLTNLKSFKNPDGFMSIFYKDKYMILHRGYASIRKDGGVTVEFDTPRHQKVSLSEDGKEIFEDDGEPVSVGSLEGQKLIEDYSYILGIACRDAKTISGLKGLYNNVKDYRSKSALVYRDLKYGRVEAWFSPSQQRIFIRRETIGFEYDIFSISQDGQFIYNRDNPQGVAINSKEGIVLFGKYNEFLAGVVENIPRADKQEKAKPPSGILCSSSQDILLRRLQEHTRKNPLIISGFRGLEARAWIDESDAVTIEFDEKEYKFPKGTSPISLCEMNLLHTILEALQIKAKATQSLKLTPSERETLFGVVKSSHISDSDGNKVWTDAAGNIIFLPKDMRTPVFFSADGTKISGIEIDSPEGPGLLARYIDLLSPFVV